MNLQKFVIYLVATFFLLYGLAFSIIPSSMSALVTGSVIEGTSAIVDFRATYGGMTLAVGLVILYLNSIQQLRPSLIVIIVVLLSMAVTRTIGFVIDGASNQLMYIYLMLEIVGSLLAILALRRNSD